jgi:hypothetical protein
MESKGNSILLKSKPDKIKLSVNAFIFINDSNIMNRLRCNVDEICTNFARYNHG